MTLWLVLPPWAGGDSPTRPGAVINLDREPCPTITARGGFHGYGERWYELVESDSEPQLTDYRAFSSRRMPGGHGTRGGHVRGGG